jgi:hypothetical protein
MRLTIIPSDNTVVVDGRGATVNLAGYPALNGVHAIQWDGEQGHIEFKNSPFSTANFKTNERLAGIGAYQNIIDTWRQVVKEIDANPPKPPPHPAETPEGIAYLKKMAEDKARIAREMKEFEDAIRNSKASPDHGRSGPQSGVRQEGGYTTVRGERVQSGGQENRNSSKEEAKDPMRRL